MELAVSLSGIPYSSIGMREKNRTYFEKFLLFMRKVLVLFGKDQDVFGKGADVWWTKELVIR